MIFYSITHLQNIVYCSIIKYGGKKPILYFFYIYSRNLFYGRFCVKVPSGNTIIIRIWRNET